MTWFPPAVFAMATPAGVWLAAMTYEVSTLAVVVFTVFVVATLAMSFYFAGRSGSASGYFAAHGQVPWAVNGVAFAGDYLSAASFLGITGMTAFYGFDGFLYGVGYLAGWVVALLVVAEPLRRLGRYTFADAMDARFSSPGVRLTVAISTLVVSLFYLIPQMVGAGALIQPLLGLPHWAGVVTVGVIVVVITATAGMVSTTYVQFFKGGLLVIFAMVLITLVMVRGVPPASEGAVSFVKPLEPTPGPVWPTEFLSAFATGQVTITRGANVTEMQGADLLQPGNHPSLAGLQGEALMPKLNFLSLMLALFCGTAALPHILIRYYTVADDAAARKSTVAGIAVIGLFYVATLFIGLGAIAAGTIDPDNSNLAAPLLARSFGEPLFAVISAIAFTTVLGTVAGLIVAAGGAIAHDLAVGFLGYDLSDSQKVRLGRLTALVVGAVAIGLGIVFEKMNVNFLVGWAFSIAASANLPALVLLLFWTGTTRQGVMASVMVGVISSLTWVLLSGDTYAQVYGLDPARSVVPFSQPGLVTIPLSLAVAVGVSLATAPVPTPQEPNA